MSHTNGRLVRMCEYQRKNNEPIERFVIAKNAKVCYDNRITNR